MIVNTENIVLPRQVIAKVMGTTIYSFDSSHAWIQILAKAHQLTRDHLPKDISPERLKRSIRIHLDDAIVSESAENINYSLFDLKQ